MKKISFFIFVLFFVWTININSAQATVPWSNVATDMAIFWATELRIELRISINAAAKMFAIKQVQSTIQASLASGSDSPKYIKNYREFLVNSPRDRAKVVTSNFLTATLEGRTSGNYISANVAADEEGIQLSYSQYLENIGRIVIEGDEDGVKVDIEEICDPLQGIFSQGNWDCFETMMNNPVNTPIGLAITTEGYLSQRTAEYQLEAQAMADASEGGFLPVVDVYGNVTLPAGISADLQAKIVTLPIDAIANSDSEAFSTLIESFAVSTISQVVQHGLGETERSYRNAVNKFSTKLNANFYEKLGKFGPEVNFNAGLFWELN